MKQRIVTETVNNYFAKSKKKKHKSKSSSNFDPQGSYTGVCADDIQEKPVQDADDL